MMAIVVEDPQVILLMKVTGDNVVMMPVLLFGHVQRNFKSDELLDSFCCQLFNQAGIRERFIRSQDENRPGTGKKDACLHGTRSFLWLQRRSAYTWIRLLFGAAYRANSKRKKYVTLLDRVCHTGI